MASNPSKTTLFKDSHPALLDEWDYDRNKDLDLDTLSNKSTKQAWWTCKKDKRHKWQTGIKNRAKQGAGCLYCANKLVLKEESFGALYPELLKEWDYEKNGALDPFKLTKQSNKRVHWICKNDRSHSWSIEIYRRTSQGSGCKLCSYKKRPKKKSSKKYLKQDYPHVARLWDSEKNSDIDISTITHGSAKEVWWKCTTFPSHNWKASVQSLTLRNRGCPFCSKGKASIQNSLLTVHPEISKEWHPTKNGDLSPDKVTRASGKKVWWQCRYDPDHEWKAVVRNRTLRNSSCPICNEDMKSLRLRGGKFLTYNENISTHYKIFTKSIHSLQSISSSMDPLYETNSKPLYRLLYASAITSLETYLADRFMSAVLNEQTYLDRLFRNANELNNKKYSVEDLLKFNQQQKQIAESYIQDLIWHNIPKAKNLYSSVLRVDFDISLLSEVNKLVTIRHDIVHRNGRDKNGFLHEICATVLEDAITSVIRFISEIEEQFQDI